MKTLLYATDYSENSIPALKYAYALSEKLGMRLVITHIFEFPSILGAEALDNPLPHIQEVAYKTNRTKLEELCKEHLDGDWDSPNLRLEASENNSVLKGILAKAEEWHSQMILVGMKGETGLREMIMGSTTKKLIEKAPCPVLAIPSDMDNTQIKTIVYATDFEEEDILAIQKLTEIAKPLDAQIKVVHISTKHEYAGNLLMDWFKELLESKVDYHKIEFELLFSEDIFDSLRDYLGVTNADLVVMLEREKKGFLKKWFHKDLVKKMESYGKVTLMSFNEHNLKTLYF